MRILFAGDVSNFYVSLAEPLRRAGHECVIVSEGCGFLDTYRDIDISRSYDLLGSVRHIAHIWKLLNRMRGFDIVHLSAPIFFEMRPERIIHVYNFLRRHNKHVFYSASGSDVCYFNVCHDLETFRYSDYFVGREPSPYHHTPDYDRETLWNAPAMVRYHRHMLDTVDGVVACLYEYHKTYTKYLPPERLAYSGIPILTDKLTPSYIESEPEKVKFFIGMYPGRTILKGQDLMLEALRRVRDRYPDKCEIIVAEKVPYEQYTAMMRDCHVMLDQLYSYTPATNALIGMAQAKVAISGAEPEYYDFIGEKDCRPIVNVSPLIEGDIDRKLEWLIQNKHMLPQLSQQSRDFVVKHNDAEVVARRHLDFWNRFL